MPNIHPLLFIPSFLYWRRWLMLLIVFFAVSSSAISQSLYEIKFGANGITYNCLVVYFDESDAYMRVAYTYNEEYNVVEVDYLSHTGKEDGYNYFIMEGSNPRFITTQNNNSGKAYNPDHFVWVWNEKTKGELPFVTDDPNFSEESLIRVKSYKELKPEDLTDTFLRQFYWTNEEEYSAFQNIRDNALGAVAQQNTNSNTNHGTTSDYDYNNYGSPRAKMHLVMLINTSIGDIGASCEIDRKNMKKEFGDIAKALQIDMRTYEVSGSSFTKSKAKQVIDGVSPDKNDIVVFYYSGHGFRWSDQKDYYPQLDIRASPYTKLTNQTTLSLSEVYNTIVAKGARLNIVMSDCCNSDIGINKLTESSFLAGRSYQTPHLQKLKKLFLGYEGNVVITSSSPGEVSWSNNINGGFFTLSFLQAFHEEISYLKNNNPTWDTILNRTYSNTKKKTSNMCSSCTVQNPVFYTKITEK